jgi:hypothetical protein
MDGEQAREHFENSRTRLQLLRRAQESGSLIEALVLYPTLVDGLLRMLVAHAAGDREMTLRGCPPSRPGR